MKKYLALLLAAMMLLSLTACGGGEAPAPEAEPAPQEAVQPEAAGPAPAPAPEAEPEAEEPAEEDVPTTGAPLGWPENEYTALVPTPTCGGKVLSSGEIGTLFSIELKWEMEQGLTYAQLLQDAGFGDDCVEKYENHGYIDRTANGLNVQLLDLFGVTSISIMPVEADENSTASESTDGEDSGAAETSKDLFEISQLADVSGLPDYAKKAIGDLRWCDDLGADNQFNHVYNVYMKEVAQGDFEAYIANLFANAPTNAEEGNIFGFYWDWGQITGEYFPDSGTLDTVLAVK